VRDGVREIDFLVLTIIETGHGDGYGSGSVGYGETGFGMLVILFAHADEYI
jgi:hypothetical protein